MPLTGPFVVGSRVYLRPEVLQCYGFPADTVAVVDEILDEAELPMRLGLRLPNGKTIEALADSVVLATDAIPPEPVTLASLAVDATSGIPWSELRDRERRRQAAVFRGEALPRWSSDVLLAMREVSERLLARMCGISSEEIIAGPLVPSLDYARVEALCAERIVEEAKARCPPGTAINLWARPFPGHRAIVIGWEWCAERCKAVARLWYPRQLRERVVDIGDERCGLFSLSGDPPCWQCHALQYDDSRLVFDLFGASGRGIYIRHEDDPAKMDYVVHDGFFVEARGLPEDVRIVTTGGPIGGKTRHLPMLCTPARDGFRTYDEGLFRTPYGWITSEELVAAEGRSLTEFDPRTVAKLVWLDEYRHHATSEADRHDIQRGFKEAFARRAP